jgi:hypothetical protein
MRALTLLALAAFVCSVPTVEAGKCDSVVSWAQANTRNYNNMCLEMCKNAWASVGVSGVSYLDAPSAHEAVGIAQGKPGWHNWDGSNPPAGAVVLFLECGNQPYGHACISDVTGCINNDGAGFLDWSNEVAHFCGHAPAGWILPAAC